MCGIINVLLMRHPVTELASHLVETLVSSAGRQHPVRRGRDIARSFAPSAVSVQTRGITLYLVKWC